jgi:hypothetical protein
MSVSLIILFMLLVVNALVIFRFPLLRNTRPSRRSVVQWLGGRGVLFTFIAAPGIRPAKMA